MALLTRFARRSGHDAKRFPLTVSRSTVVLKGESRCSSSGGERLTEGVGEDSQGCGRPMIGSANLIVRVAERYCNSC